MNLTRRRAAHAATRKFALGFCLLLGLPLPSGTSAAGNDFTILVFGDSLSAAYGMAPEAGWPSLLAGRVAARGARVVNRSVGGETTAGGLRRLGNALEDVRPGLVILELGANDGLRGLDPGAMENNLARMVSMSRNAGARVLLLGMRIPPNYGPAYTEAFAAVYPRLAERLDVPLVSFFLEPVADDWDKVQDDGIHPTAAAQPLLLDHIWPRLEGLLPGDAGG